VQARAATETAAANAALRILGHPPIADIDNGTSLAEREARAAFGDARDETLRSKEWNFATAWENLAAAPVAGRGRLKRLFPLPADCIKVRFVEGLGRDDWAIETAKLGTPPADANVLATNAEAALLCYTRCITNVALWDPEFLGGFAHRLAAKLAGPLAREYTAGAALDSLADDKIDDAARTDAREKAPTSISRHTSWTRARR